MLGCAFLIFFLLFTLIPHEALALVIVIFRVFTFIGEVLAIAAWTVVKALWFVTAKAARLTGRDVYLAATFLYFLTTELLRGAPDDQAEDAGADEDEHDDALYEVALTLLGLPRDFTRAALDAAYKKAIRKAHPDAGGSIADAQAVNVARDLLLLRLRAA